MGWNEPTVMVVMMLLLLACELAACMALAVLVARRALAWARRRRGERLGRVRGFEVKFPRPGAGVAPANPIPAVIR